MCLEPLWNASDEMRHAIGPQQLGISFAMICSEFMYTAFLYMIMVPVGFMLNSPDCDA